jgi:hypothetical protein
MKLVGLVGAVACLATACTANGPLVASNSPTPAVSASPSALASPAASPSTSPTASPNPGPTLSVPFVQCVTTSSGGPVVLIGRAIYDVTNPVRPTLICRFRNTEAHLYAADTFTYLREAPNGIEVVVHPMGSGNESVIAAIPLASPSWGGYIAWTPDGSAAATTTQSTDSAGYQWIHVWLYSQRNATELYRFLQPLTDCICRFGLPRPMLAFSADGQYLVSGWPIGKGATPAVVWRVTDRARVASLDQNANIAAWDWKGHRLFVSGMSGSQTWTPEGGFVSLKGAKQWPYEAGVGPGGAHVAYTAYADGFTPTSLRVWVYDVSNDSTRMVIDSLRSEVVFVEPDWVWYKEEATCDPLACGAPWGTAPTGGVFGMNLGTGVERSVYFLPGQRPDALDSGWGPAEFWPNS